MSETESDSSKTINTVGRAMEVLTLFTERPEPTLGVTEISTTLGLSKAVVHRILSTLLDKGYIQVDAQTRRYALGRASLRLGLTYLERIDIRQLARPYLLQLVEETEETATISIRTGWTRVYIDQVTPPTDIKMSVRLGIPHELHAGSSSKALLAFLEPEEQEAYLSRGQLNATTHSTITDPERLRNDLAEIRSRGYARSLAERQEGAASVAAPVLDHNAHPVASLSVCGPLERFAPKMDAAASHLLAVTRDLSAQLGHVAGGTA